MKKKEIITLVACGVVIAICVFAMVQILMPKSQTKSVQKESVTPIPEAIDENAYNSIGNLQDYGKPNLEGLGKTDLFN